MSIALDWISINSPLVIPVVGQVSDFSSWLPLVATLDDVVDAVGGTEIRELSNNTLDATIQAASQLRPSHAPKLTYIYSSGTWVHGESRKEIVTDTTPLIAPIDFIAWRVEQEQRVVTESTLNGIVIRPALLYGRSGSLLASLFKSAYQGKVAWFGGPTDRYALIHCDDLANLYLLATERAQLVKGQIFDAANDFTEGLDDLLKKLVEISGASGPHEFVKPSNRKCTDFPILSEIDVSP